MSEAPTDLPVIDVLSTEFLDDPARVYDGALGQAELASCPFGPMVIGHQAVRDVLRDENLVQPQRLMFQMFGIEGGPFKEWFSSHIQALDGADHARIRRLVSRSFSQRAAEQGRAMMREIINELLEPLLADKQFDFVRGFSSVFPIRVFCRMIGVPEEDVPRFAHWAEVEGQGMDMNMADIIDDLDAATEGMLAYVEELVQRRSDAIAAGESGDDLVGSLIAASEEGDRLTHPELVSLICLLLGAGYDTTANQLAWGVRLLAERPDVLDRIRQTPADVPKFIEELLRVRPAVCVTGRVTEQAIEVDGSPVPEGSYVLVSVHAAGRDPRVYDNPAHFDMDRTPGPTLLTFGWGEHYCLGVHLARGELEEFFTIFSRRVRSVRETAAPETGNPLGVYALKSLPVEVEPRGLDA